MESRFGARWCEQFAGLDLETVMSDWAEDLSDLSDKEIHDGLLASRDLRYPPSVGEFRVLCKKNFCETPENHPMYQVFAPSATTHSIETQESVKLKIKEMKAKLRSEINE